MDQETITVKEDLKDVPQVDPNVMSQDGDVQVVPPGQKAQEGPGELDPRVADALLKAIFSTAGNVVAGVFEPKIGPEAAAKIPLDDSETKILCDAWRSFLPMMSPLTVAVLTTVAVLGGKTLYITQAVKEANRKGATSGTKDQGGQGRQADTGHGAGDGGQDVVDPFAPRPSAGPGAPSGPGPAAAAAS